MSETAAAVKKPIRTFFDNFKTDNGTSVTVEYSYEDHGDCVCIWECWTEPEPFELGDVALDVKLTDAEDERMCAWIMENRNWNDHAPAGDVFR